MADKQLIKFIKECRKRGYEDYEIRAHLKKLNWPSKLIEEAFISLKEPMNPKNRIEIYLPDDLLKKVQARAKKNMFTLPEQIEDILRRSVLSMRRKTPKEEKIDDKLVALFSRKQTKK